jgi:hypothetical protein
MVDYVTQMRTTRYACIVLVGKLLGKWPLRRPRR